MNLKTLAVCCILALSSLTIGATRADDRDKATTKQKMEEAGRDTKRGAKKAWRGAKDETCEMVNGKMECAAKKAKHSIQNTSDKIEDAVE